MFHLFTKYSVLPLTANGPPPAISLSDSVLVPLSALSRMEAKPSIAPMGPPSSQKRCAPSDAMLKGESRPSWITTGAPPVVGTV